MPAGLLAVLVFVGSSAAVLGILMMLSRRPEESLKKAVDGRLLELSGGTPEPPDESLIRSQAEGPLPMVDRAARRVVRGLAIERWVEQSGLRLSISGLLIIAAALGGAVGFVALAFTGLMAAAAGGFFIGVALPFIVVRQKRASRLYKFEEHFPEALDLISRAIRAGHAFSAGMKMVAEELDAPVGPEFRKAFEEQNFGMSLKEALNNLADRVPILDVRFFATAVLIQKETGGNLSEILDSLAAVVRERFKIRRQVRVHTAHGRFTGYVLLALPAALGLALSLINPEHMSAMFNDRIGQMLITAAIVMQFIGWVWIKRVIKIEV